MLDRARANGVVLPWLTFDEGYGRATEFLHALDDRGQQYVAEVPTTFTGWTTRPPLLRREHHPRDRLGRPRSFPRLAASARPASEVRDLLRCSSALNKQPWERFHVKDATKGPAVWEAKIAPFFLKRDGLPTTRPHWLVVARKVLEPDVVKSFVSNAPAGTPPEVVLHVAFNRWPVERCFEDTKTELGLDHFEGRTYDALIRHLAITAVMFLFLSKVRLDRGEKKSGPDRVPGADRRRRAGRLGGPVPDLPPRAPRAGGGADHPRPGPEPAGRRLPPPSHARAA
jgi:SRSO17 transposase